jgi:hypothetical protein
MILFKGNGEGTFHRRSRFENTLMVVVITDKND